MSDRIRSRPMSISRPSSRTPLDHHEHWGVQALWEALQADLPDLSIEVVEQLSSTNQALLDRLREAARNAPLRGIRSDDLSPSLLVAIQQTRGRGRLGRSWESAPGASLTFSLSLTLNRADWSGLSLAVGLALAQALDPQGGQIGLKWPNDLWRIDAPGQGRKLGGILIESLPLGDQRVAVIGVGLNLLPIHLPELAIASLSEFLPNPSPAQTLSKIMLPLAQMLSRFEREGFAGIATAYAERDLLRHQWVQTNDPVCPQGQSIGVAEDGALLLERDGRQHRIVSGEVSVRPLPAAAPPASASR